MNRNTISFLLFMDALIISSSFSATTLYAETNFCSTPPISISFSEEDDGTEPTVTQFLVASKDLRWILGKTVKVAFDFQGRNLVSSYKPYMCKSVTTQKECETLIINEVATAANTWSKYGNIAFQFGVPWNEGEIRVRFVDGRGGWSRVGTQALSAVKYDPNTNTMELGLDYTATSEVFRGVVIHEFGHAIGFQHEHQSPRAPYTWQDQIFLDYDALGWTPEKVIEFILTPLDELSYISKADLSYTKYDPYSIMVYWIKSNWVSAADKANRSSCPSQKPEWCVEFNTKLSEMDKGGIAQLYPGVPFPPSNLSATVLSSSSIKIVWADKSNNETGFKIYWWDGSKWSPIATVKENVTSYTNTGLQAGTSYSYLVSAYNNVKVDNYSNYTTAATARPVAPSNLSATALSSSSIKVMWDDKSNNETGFKIYRWDDSKKKWSPPIATVGANVTSYTNTGLQARTTYYHIVSAYNGVGESYASKNTLATTK